MSDFREEEKLGKLYDSQLTRRLMQYLRPYRLQVVLAVSFTLGITALEILGPFLFSVGIDRFIIPGFDGRIARAAAVLGLVWVAAAYCGSILASFGLQYVQVRIMQWVGQETMYDLRKEIFEHLQRLPMSFFDRSPIGRLVTRSTTDVDALNDLFVQVASGAGARHFLPASIHDSADLFFPQSRARCESPDSHSDCAHQCFSAGACERHGRGAAVQPRAEIAREIRRTESHAHGGLQGCD
jgi:ABC-type multidrug transport system fused ATPase/permease subunit